MKKFEFFTDSNPYWHILPVACCLYLVMEELGDSWYPNNLWEVVHLSICYVILITAMVLVIVAILFFSCTVLLFALIYVVWKNRKAAQRQPMTAFTPKSPLLQPRLSSSIYGLEYNTEPVYAGWWTASIWQDSSLMWKGKKILYSL